MENCSRSRAQATSPLMFESDEEDSSDDDPANTSNKENADENVDRTSELTKEEKILKGFQTVLMGIPPPPAFTVPQFDSREILKLWRDHQKFRLVLSPGKGKQNLARQLEEEVKVTPWPEVLNVDHWDIYYNKSAVCEEVERLSLRYKERYVGSETSSCINALFAKSPTRTASARKRARTRAWGHSPGRRLSHLARRRNAFSSANLCSVAGNNNPDKKMIMVEIKKIGNRSKKKGSAKKSKPTPQKKSQTQTNTHKRALFQSPDQPPAKDVTQTPNTRCVLRSKRNLFADSSSEKINENGKRERPVPKRVSPRKRVNRSLSFQDHSQETAPHLNMSLQQTKFPTTQSSQSVLSGTHKQKMLWAVTNALREENMGMNHELFRPCMSVLFKACQKLWLMNTAIREQEGSTSENMLALAKQFSVYTIKQINSDPTSEHMALVCTNIIRQAENNLCKTKPKQDGVRQLLSRNPLSELSCSKENASSPTNCEEIHKSSVCKELKSEAENSKCSRNGIIGSPLFKMKKNNNKSPLKIVQKYGKSSQITLRTLRSTPNKIDCNSSIIESRTPKKTPSKLISKYTDLPSTSTCVTRSMLAEMGVNRTVVNSVSESSQEKTPSKSNKKVTNTPKKSSRCSRIIFSDLDSNTVTDSSKINACTSNKKTPSKCSIQSTDSPKKTTRCTRNIFSDLDANTVTNSSEINACRSSKKTPSKSSMQCIVTPEKASQCARSIGSDLDANTVTDSSEMNPCSKKTPSKSNSTFADTPKKSSRCTRSIFSALDAKAVTDSLETNSCNKKTPSKSNINFIGTPKKSVRCTRSISTDMDTNSAETSSCVNKTLSNCPNSVSISNYVTRSVSMISELESSQKETPLKSILKSINSPCRTNICSRRTSDSETNPTPDGSETNTYRERTPSKSRIKFMCTPEISSCITRTMSFDLEVKNEGVELEKSSTNTLAPSKLIAQSKESPIVSGRMIRSSLNEATTSAQTPEKTNVQLEQISRKISFDMDAKMTADESEIRVSKETSNKLDIKQLGSSKRIIPTTRRMSCNTEIDNSVRINLLHRRTPPKMNNLRKGLTSLLNRRTRSLSCDIPGNINNVTKPVFLKPTPPKGSLKSKNSPRDQYDRKYYGTKSDSTAFSDICVQDSINVSNELLPASPEFTSPITRSRSGSIKMKTKTEDNASIDSTLVSISNSDSASKSPESSSQINICLNHNTDESVHSEGTDKCSQNGAIDTLNTSPFIKCESEKSLSQRTNSSYDETTLSSCENNKESLDFTLVNDCNNETVKNSSSQKPLFSVENTPQSVEMASKNRMLHLYKLSNCGGENVDNINNVVLPDNEPPTLVPHWEHVSESEETSSSLQSPPSLVPHWEQPSSGTSTSLPESIMSHWQQLTNSVTVNTSDKIMFDLEDTSFEITFPSTNEDSRASSTCVPFDFPHLVDDSKSGFNVVFRKNSFDS